MLLEKLIQTEYDGTSGLYVCVTPTKRSADILVAIGEVLGMRVNPEELHVTLMYSRVPTSSVSSRSWSDTMTRVSFPALISGIELFGENADHVVVTLDSHDMKQEHLVLTQMGATHSWDEFKPHCTLGKLSDGYDSSMVKKIIPLIKGKELWFEKYKWSNLSEEENG